MGLDYLMVHITYNIPWAILMTSLSWPFLTRLDCAKIQALVMVSLIATIPWDSYLVRNRIWTYHPDAVTGYTLFSIPLEEVFFFVIQTYNTSLLYTILTRKLVLPAYLRESSNRQRTAGTILLLILALGGGAAVYCGHRYTYLGLIVVWTSPWLLIQWAFSSDFISTFPRKGYIASVMIPTVFLWVVDTVSLKSGTWVIADSTKLDIQPWTAMDLEEAIFFFITNVMIVNGLIVADHAIALMHCQQAQSAGKLQEEPSCSRILANFMASPKVPDPRFVRDLHDAVHRLAIASQSMYLGSAMFQGSLRIDLIFLYSFCRVVDDLVDEAPSTKTAQSVVEQCNKLLMMKFSSPLDFTDRAREAGYNSQVTQQLINAINRLPVSRLQAEPLQSLLKGFRTDLKFDAQHDGFPIGTEADLDEYSYHVAGTIATSVLQLVSHRHPCHPLTNHHALRDEVFRAGVRMGKGLQYINIARDIGRDAAINRVYLPTSWLREVDLSPADVICCPLSPRLKLLRSRLLAKAKEYHDSSVAAIQKLPTNTQAPLRATVMSYMEIGVVLSCGFWPAKPNEKLNLPLMRRLVVAYKAMANIG
ncbi:phytoene synthase [Aspergillus ambiguus]|uniref:phytoene synthase n=1 Tax=Aspergillus ambiguus TaxID=176160 RepID=UPI003CCDF6CA